MKRINGIKLFIAFMLFIIIGMTAFCADGNRMTVHAYTEEEKNAAKAWLSANGYPPTMEGAQQAYQDYLDGKFGPPEEIAPSEDTTATEETSPEGTVSGETVPGDTVPGGTDTGENASGESADGKTAANAIPDSTIENNVSSGNSGQKSNADKSSNDKSGNSEVGTGPDKYAEYIQKLKDKYKNSIKEAIKDRAVSVLNSFVAYGMDKQQSVGYKTSKDYAYTTNDPDERIDGEKAVTDITPTMKVLLVCVLIIVCAITAYFIIYYFKTRKNKEP